MPIDSIRSACVFRAAKRCRRARSAKELAQLTTSLAAFISNFAGLMPHEVHAPAIESANRRVGIPKGTLSISENVQSGRARASRARAVHSFARVPREPAKSQRKAGWALRQRRNCKAATIIKNP